MSKIPIIFLSKTTVSPPKCKYITSSSLSPDGNNLRDFTIQKDSGFQTPVTRFMFKTERNAAAQGVVPYKYNSLSC